MTSIIMVILAIAIILVGLVLFPLPIPFGVPLVIIGVTILIANSVYAARKFAVLRQSWPRFNGWIEFLENRAPDGFARILRRTRPERL